MPSQSRFHALRTLLNAGPPSSKFREDVALALGLVLLLVYGSFRQRYIWGVDSFGYFELGRLFSEGRVYLDAHLLRLGEPALVPLGFSLNAAGHAVPHYPPGFPLLLALGHLLRAPMWVNPMVGVVSCFLLHRLLRSEFRPATAALFTLAWAFMPLTVYGSTMVMSDLVAATGLMGGLLAFRGGRPGLAAWILGLSIAVRPTNVLFLVPFALLLRFDRTALRFAAHLAASCALYGGYNFWLYGAPWRTGYGDIVAGLDAGLFPSHFRFYAVSTVQILTPLLVVLAGVGLFPWNRQKAFLLGWPLVFAGFYAFWDGGLIDRWWWARFILPGYPAVFLLAARGYEAAGDGLAGWLAPRPARVARWGLALAVLALPPYFVRFGRQQDFVWQRTIGAVNHEAVRRITQLAPAGSVVGSLELASTFALYSPLTPFVPIYESSPDLVARFLAEGRRVFLLPEPWYEQNRTIQELNRRFAWREVAHFDFLWGGQKAYELTAR